MEFEAQDRQKRISDAINNSALMAEIVVKQLMHPDHGEMYLVLEPVDQDIAPSEMIKILEMAKIEAMRQMGSFS